MTNVLNVKQVILYILEHVYYALHSTQVVDHAQMELLLLNQNAHHAILKDFITQELPQFHAHLVLLSVKLAQLLVARHV